MRGFQQEPKTRNHAKNFNIFEILHQIHKTNS